MGTMYRVCLAAAICIVASALLFGCGGGAQGDTTASTEEQSATTAQAQTTSPSETTAATTGESSAQTETEVSGMPADFPSDVPVHPGTVTDFVKTEVTKTMIVYQLTVDTSASLDDVIEWYKTKLPSGWSVGYESKEGDEAKIALNGGDYTPAKADGRGGGVLVGLAKGAKTRIVTTVTVMGK